MARQNEMPDKHVSLPSMPADAVRSLPKRKRPGFFSRLFSTGGTHDKIEIGIARFVDAAGVDHARELQAAFSDITGIRTRMLREQSEIDPTQNRVAQLPLACADAIQWLGRYKLDIVIWGDIPHPGTTLYLHIASKPPADEDPPGTTSPFQILALPVGFAAPLGALVRAVALGALCSTNAAKHTVRFALAPGFVEDAIEAMAHLPEDFTDRETAFAYTSFANALYALAHLAPGTDHIQRISLAYSKALKSTTKAESPINWAYLQKNLGGVLQTIGERGRGDVETLERARNAFTEALAIFSFERTPFPWAVAKNHLGEILYRLDLISGEAEGIETAIEAYRDALKVFNRKQTPHLWANVMNNFSQSSQFLGRELNDLKMIENAVLACRSALEVRNREETPLPWALTQNNLGSGLFLLGRTTHQVSYYEEARGAFESAREIYASLGMKRMVAIIDKNLTRVDDRLPGGAAGPGDSAMWWQDEGEDNIGKDLATASAEAIADEAPE